MWKVIKYRLAISWMWVLMLLGMTLLVFLISDSLFYTITEEGIKLSDKTWILLLSYLCMTIFLLTYILYQDYSSGKLRYMLLRKHRLSWMMGDVVWSVLILVILYIVIATMMNQGLKDVIQLAYPKATASFLHSRYLEAVTMDPYLNQLLVMNVCHSGQLVLWLFAISFWIHTIAVNRIMMRQRALDIIICLMILPHIFSLFYWTNIPISLMISITCFYYGNRCWEPVRMYS